MPTNWASEIGFGGPRCASQRVGTAGERCSTDGAGSMDMCSHLRSRERKIRIDLHAHGWLGRDCASKSMAMSRWIVG